MYLSFVDSQIIAISSDGMTFLILSLNVDCFIVMDPLEPLHAEGEGEEDDDEI